MQTAQRFPKHFNFILRRRLFALGLLKGAKNFLNLVQNSPQFSPHLQHLLNGFANT
jgi:hypothetical protein